MRSVKFPVVAALLANVGVAVAKLVAFLFTGSTAMLAETLHSVADSGNEVLLLRGEIRARQPASRRHPFGYGRYRYVSAFLVSVAIFTVGGLFALYEGARKVFDRAPVEQPAWALGVLAVSMLLEGASLRTAIVGASRVRGERGWWEFVRTTKTPDLAVVLLEDFGALVGLAFAFAGVTASTVTRNGLWDGAASLAIGVLLVGIASLLGVETHSLLLGESASPRRVALIRRVLLAVPGVRGVRDLRTSHLSPQELLVVGSVQLDPAGSAVDAVATVEDAVRRVRAALDLRCLVYLQPTFTGVGARRLDMERPDTERPDIERPDIERPDMERPDMERPDIERRRSHDLEQL